MRFCNWRKEGIYFQSAKQGELGSSHVDLTSPAAWVRVFKGREAEVIGKVINQYMVVIHWFDLKIWDILKQVLSGFKDFLICDWLRRQSFV